jgi:hypothetical protein
MYCAFSISSRTSSTPVLLAASISSRSTKRPASIARQAAQTPQGSALVPVLAVQRLGEDARDRGLADAARAGEQEGVVHLPAVQRIGQRARTTCSWPDQFGETLGPPLAGEDEIGHAPVFAARIDDGKALPGLVQDALGFAPGEYLVGLIVEPSHRAAAMLIAHPTLEAAESTGCRCLQFAPQGVAIDARVTQPEPAHPPDTGGRNATSASACKGASQATKAPLTAARKRSGPKRKPWRPCSSRYSAATSAAEVRTDSCAQPAASRSEAKYSTST